MKTNIIRSMFALALFLILFMGVNELMTKKTSVEHAADGNQAVVEISCGLYQFSLMNNGGAHVKRGGEVKFGGGERWRTLEDGRWEVTWVERLGMSAGDMMGTAIIEEATGQYRTAEWCHGCGNLIWFEGRDKCRIRRPVGK